LISLVKVPSKPLPPSGRVAFLAGVAVSPQPLALISPSRAAVISKGRANRKGFQGVGDIGGPLC
jgi:hypothetical protein